MKATGISPGIGLGIAFILNRTQKAAALKSIVDSEKEISDLNRAIASCKEELLSLCEKTSQQTGDDAGMIFSAHKAILEDPELLERVEHKIRTEMVGAAYAIQEVSLDFIRIFEAMDNDYIKGRAADIREVTDRVICFLNGGSDSGLENIPGDSIIMAGELTARDTVLIDRKKVKGIVVENGSATSHVAILARSLEIPAVTAEGIVCTAKSGDRIIIDGGEGNILINPPMDIENAYLKKLADDQAEKEKKKAIAKQTAITEDGCCVMVEANINGIEELESAMENGCDGIGLFRTEFLFMKENRLPTEEEQFCVYRKAAEMMGDRKLVFRTLDVGGDKEISYLNLSVESNPFLGFRGIRFCLGEKQIFKTQLRALLKASAYGSISIMFPMICTADELREAKAVLEEAKTELRKENVPFQTKIPVGIMMEIPSAAMISDILAKEADFFSIGTNDLMQYLFAVDRLNSKVEYLYSPYHPALLRMVRLIIDQAHKAGIPVAMCGEAAANEKLIPLLLGMGLDEFSVSSGALLRTKEIIMNSSKERMASRIEEILSCDSPAQVIHCLENREAEGTALGNQL